MGSSTVEAQKLANATNLQMTRETNDLNRSLAEAQNELNYRMFNEQNQWNLEQWQRENEYNSPEQQVERYLKAGINPLWAIGNGNPGNAQQLTSAEAKPAERAEMVAPHVQPEADPSRLTNIVAAARDVSNSALGFEKLRLDALDVDTRRAAQISRSSLDMASAANKAVKYRRKRSLDANSYAWILMTKIADAIESSKEEIYEDMLQKYGAVYEDEDGYITMTVKKTVDMTKIDGHWKFIKDNGKFASYLMIKGSSEYDTAEMSRFIDRIIEEAKELGIETATPDEVERMKQEWHI